ncbi:MAG: hypothetical protein J6Z44_03310 [Bacteroidales bacterium]|nr:hypothetical protein [Bacteroidales bacterium]
MGTTGMIWDDASPVTLEKPAAVEIAHHGVSVALIADDMPLGDFAWITPNAVRTLVENHVKVYMQRGFAEHSPYSDMDYADVGAEFEDEFVRLAAMSPLLVKFMPFTEEQIGQMREGQIILSTQQAAQMSLPQAEMLLRKKISALAMNLIRDAQGLSVTDRILSETLTPVGLGIALSNFVLPMILNILFSPRFRFALQRTPALMQSVYCYDGHLCNAEMAELLGLPWKDIVTLCWDLN